MILIIGQNPNDKGEEKYHTASGKYLRDILMNGYEYPWQNLCEGEWDWLEARSTAWEINRITPPTTKFVLLGKKVADVFEIVPHDGVTVKSYYGRTVLYIPHPSGKNRYYNNPEHVLQVQAELEEFIK